MTTKTLLLGAVATLALLAASDAAMAAAPKGQTLKDVIARLDALERENAQLRREVQDLKGGAPQETMDHSGPPHGAPHAMGDGPRHHGPDRDTKGITVSAAILGLTPGTGDTSYVIASPVTTGAPNGTRLNNDPDSDTGYRVGLAYDFGGKREIQATYTHMSENQSSAVAGDFLWATTGRADLTSTFENYTGTAVSQSDISYDRVDLVMSEPLKWHDARVALIYGFEFAEQSLAEDIVYDAPGGPTTGVIAQRSRMRGFGPQLGLGADYELFRNPGNMPGALSVSFLSSGSLLLADTRASVSNTLNATNLLSVADEETTRVIPALHMRAGLAYDAWFSGAKATLAVGYEYNGYIGAITRVDYPDDVADALASSNYENFDLTGPYASLGVKF